MPGQRNGHVKTQMALVANSQAIEAMHLTQNEYHKKLRAPISDISDWLMNADVSGFATPFAMLTSGLHQCTPYPSPRR